MGLGTDAADNDRQCFKPGLLNAYGDTRILSSREVPAMTILQRTLTYAADSGDVEVPVSVGAPCRGERDWSCAYEIGWPGEPRRGFGHGVDATQATLLALKVIGTDLYTSDYHRSGRLRWLEPGDGDGYPVPKVIGHLLIGGDAADEG